MCNITNDYFVYVYMNIAINIVWNALCNKIYRIVYCNHSVIVVVVVAVHHDCSQ
jgi:hypothetical protein